MSPDCRTYVLERLRHSRALSDEALLYTLDEAEVSLRGALRDAEYQLELARKRLRAEGGSGGTA